MHEFSQRLRQIRELDEQQAREAKEANKIANKQAQERYAEKAKLWKQFEKSPVKGVLIQAAKLMPYPGESYVVNNLRSFGTSTREPRRTDSSSPIVGMALIWGVVGWKTMSTPNITMYRYGWDQVDAVGLVEGKRIVGVSFNGLPSVDIQDKKGMSTSLETAILEHPKTVTVPCRVNGGVRDPIREGFHVLHMSRR